MINSNILNEVLMNWTDSENIQSNNIISSDDIRTSIGVPGCITYPWLKWPIGGWLINYIKGYNNYKATEWILQKYNIESLFKDIKSNLNKIGNAGYCDTLSNCFSPDKYSLSEKQSHCTFNEDPFKGITYLVNHVLWNIDKDIWVNREVPEDSKKTLQIYIYLAKILNDLFSDPEIIKIAEREIKACSEEDKWNRGIIYIIDQKESDNYINLQIETYWSSEEDKKIFETKIKNIYDKWNFLKNREEISHDWRNSMTFFMDNIPLKN